MKTFVGLFLSSAVFGAVISIVYWFSSHEYAGTLMLGLMFMALTFASAYAVLQERRAHLAGDDKSMKHKDAAGDDLGIVTKESPWPLLFALSVLVLFIGVVWSDFLIFLGVVCMLLCLWRLGAESARISGEPARSQDGSETIT